MRINPILTNANSILNVDISEWRDKLRMTEGVIIVERMRMKGRSDVGRIRIKAILVKHMYTFVDDICAGGRGRWSKFEFDK